MIESGLRAYVDGVYTGAYLGKWEPGPFNDEQPECRCRCHEHPEGYTHRKCLLCGHQSPYVCDTGWSENPGVEAMREAPTG